MTSTALVPLQTQPSAGELVSLVEGGSLSLPRIIIEAGPNATRRFLEFFTVNIRNPNTRRAYARAAMQFLMWCEQRGVSGLTQVEPMTVAAYIEQHQGEAQSVKQQLAGIRMLFDWLVIGQVVPTNPAHSVRGPKYSYKKGKTPVLSGEDARNLLDSIDTKTVIGLRDRALIALMVFSFARVGAVVGVKVEDYYQNGKRWWVRLHEKGGKFHELPVHHTAEAYLDAYLDVAEIRAQMKTPLFRAAHGRAKKLSERALNTVDVWRMIKKRSQAVGLPLSICCHTFRATGITVYLENGGTVEKAQQIAAHESPRTTKLYDRRDDQVSLDEIERIVL